MKRIYLDHNATTPVRREVREAVLPFLDELYGNPSSRHFEGRQVRTRFEEARAQIASALNTEPDTLVFNSGATEGNNTILRGYWVNFKEKRNRNHIVISSVEHPCVLATARYLTKHGFELTLIPVDKKGMIDPNVVAGAIKDNTGLVSIMMVNNETGNIYPIKKIAEMAHAKGILMHTDAAQAVGKIPVDVKDLDVDFLTLSGHKFYALKGTGVLYAKKGRKYEPYLMGGHQERSRRSGTENVIGVVSMGEALKHAVKEMANDRVRIGELRDYFERRVLDEIPYTTINGDPSSRIYTTSNISFRFIEGEGILLKLDYLGVGVSTGSACSSGTLEPSHVITAMCIDEEEAHSSIRFSLGKSTIQEDIDYTVDKLKEIIAQLRSYSPMYDKFLTQNKK